MHKQTTIAAALIGAVVGTSTLAQGAVVSFENDGADSYASNFHQLFKSSTANVEQKDGTFQHKATSASTVVALYDNNPSGGGPTTFTGNTFTVSADVYLPENNNSFGFVLGDRDGNDDDLLAIFNVNSDGDTGTDLIRFVSDNGISSTPVTGNFTTNGTTSAKTGLTKAQWFAVTLTATPGSGSATNFVMSVDNGTTELKNSTAFSFTLPANFEIGFRTGNGSGNALKVDNFTITVPEPTTVAGLGLAGLLALKRRRRA